MKTAIRVGGPASGGREQFEATVELAIEAEKLGVTEAMAECDFRMVEGGGEALQLDAMTARLCTLLGN